MRGLISSFREEIYNTNHTRESCRGWQTAKPWKRKNHQATSAHPLIGMDGLQIAIPIVGIVAAAAVTFYAVSFAEIREKSFKDLEDSEENQSGQIKFSMTSRERRAARRNKADRK